MINISRKVRVNHLIHDLILLSQKVLPRVSVPVGKSVQKVIGLISSYGCMPFSQPTV